MNKKIIGIFGILMLLIIASVIPQAIGKEEKTDSCDRTLFAVGFIRIDSTNFIIKGFVVFGIDAGQTILFEKINIKCDEPPILFINAVPFVFNIRYDPA
jgi:uncharacterized protein with PQ loop repeat